MAKLTLSVNNQVVANAKLYAQRSGMSVSKMVETYLAAVAERSSPAATQVRVLQLLRGSLKKADPRQYRTYLSKKYL